MRRGAARLAVGLAALLGTASLHAATHDEAIQGELSNDRLLPTLLMLDYSQPATNGERGHNIVSGRLGGDGAGSIDRDYLHIVVPDGYALTEWRIGQQTQFGGTGSFYGIASGDTMPVAPDATSASGLLGWRIVGPGDRGTSVLDEMAVSSNGASGFGSGLLAGDYTIWTQELSAGSFAYRYNLVLSPVPDAPAGVAGVAGLVALAALRSRRGRTD